AVVATDASERVAARLGPTAIAADDVLVVADPDAPGSRLRAVLEGIPAGDGPLSHRLALAARRLADGGPVAADERLPDLLIAGDEQLALRIAERALAPLADDRSGRLTETLAAWLDAQGHHPTVAARLHIHPQTVRYRLARLRERLGGKLDDPAQRFALQVAMRTRQSIMVAR